MLSHKADECLNAYNATISTEVERTVTCPVCGNTLSDICYPHEYRLRDTTKGEGAAAVEVANMKEIIKNGPTGRSFCN